MGGPGLTRSDLFVEGVHPTDAGYKLIGKAVYDKMFGVTSGNGNIKDIKVKSVYG